MENNAAPVAQTCTQIRGVFDVRLTPQSNDSDHAMGRMLIDKTFHGDLQATSVGQMLSVRSLVEGSAGYVAMEWVTGQLQGRQGRFALQHSGTMHDGKRELRVSVVPNSGSEELTGLRGDMEIIITDGQHEYVFDYWL